MRALFPALGLAAGLVALSPAPAAANNGFFTRDLGTGGSGAECLRRAEATLRAYLSQIGMPGAAVEMGTWSAAIFGVTAARADVQIACPYRDDRADVVLMVVHSTGTDQDREALSDTIDTIWARTPDPGTAPLRK